MYFQRPFGPLVHEHDYTTSNNIKYYNIKNYNNNIATNNNAIKPLKKYIDKEQIAINKINANKIPLSKTEYKEMNNDILNPIVQRVYDYNEKGFTVRKNSFKSSRSSGLNSTNVMSCTIRKSNLCKGNTFRK